MSPPSPQSIKQFVRAGAGTGKTWNLIRQVTRQALDFKQNHGRWPRTVLTTFTRKATQELRERLLIYSFKENPQVLEFVQSKSFLNITTMHGLFHAFLTRYGAAMGLPGEFQIVDGVQAHFWRRQILKDLLTRKQVPDFLGSFGISRLLDSLHDFEPIYWTQSYRAMELQDFESLYQDQCQRIAWKLKEFMDEVSSVLTTEKWQEYWRNLGELIEQLDSQTPTSHKPSSHKPAYEKWGQERWAKRMEIFIALRESLNKPRQSKNNPGLPDEQNEKLRKILKTLDDFLKKNEFDPVHWPKIVGQLRDFNGFAHVFMDKLIDRKKKEAALEPNDLEFFSLHLIKKQTQTAKTFSNDIDAWFIDEFQDTSPLQLKILETLIAENLITSSETLGNPFIFFGGHGVKYL